MSAAMFSCAVDAQGDVNPCLLERVAGLDQPGGVAVWADFAYVMDLADDSLVRCHIVDGGSLDACTSLSSSQRLAAPYGMAVSSGRLYISQLDNSLAICALDTSGDAPLCQRATGDGAFSGPAGVAAGGRFVFVANQRDDSVAACLLSSAGGLSNCARERLGGLVRAPTGMAHEKGRVYVTNLIDSSVTMCKVGGGGRLEQCSRFSDPKTLSLPLGIALNGTRAYVANLGNHSLAECRLDASGALVSCRAAQVGTEFMYPSGVVFHPEQQP